VTVNLTLSENHAMLRQTVRSFVSSHVAQQATEWDHARALPEATLRALGELGLLGVLVDESRGGAGMDTLACAIAAPVLAPLVMRLAAG
jgi:alkylation response protein AidB-like acyl-CoA dehydrogenase